MDPQVQEIIEALQGHLNSANTIVIGPGIVFREPVPAITCRDGTQFSIQAGEMVYSTPRSNHGPWTAVEVMTLTEGAQPRNWEHDAGDNLAGFVPIEAVAQEILDRGHLVLTD